MSDEERKARCDAKLKTLPEERQAQIIELLRAKGGRKTVAELRADGLETSTGALSEFWRWWRLQQQFKADASTTQQLLDQLKADIPSIPDSQLDEFGQRTFSLLAIRREDPDAFLKVRTARFKGEIEREKIRLRQEAEKRHQEKLELEKQRFRRETLEKVIAKYLEDQEAQKVMASAATHAEKIEQLGRIMFGEDWD